MQTGSLTVLCWYIMTRFIAMKLLIIKAFVLFIRVLYAPMKLRKTKNKIVWLSRQSDEKSEDIKRLSEEIEKLSPETIQVFRLKKLKDESGLSLSYVFSVFVDMWELSDASIAVADTYSIPLSCLNHKKNLKKIQIWHALGAVKKFSLQSVGKAQGRNEAVSIAMCMHKNYDIVIAPSAAPFTATVLLTSAFSNVTLCSVVSPSFIITSIVAVV